MRTLVPSRRDDAGSMPLAILLTVVGVLLSSVLASIVTVRTTSTRQAVRSQHALDAAQAGLDVAVGHIRAAHRGNDPTGVNHSGSLSTLPCSGESVAQQKLAPALRTAAFTGAVGVGGGADYRVYISYTRTRGGEPIDCRNPGGVARAPAFAELVAIGTDYTADHTRTLHATYTFRTTNENIPGGLIHVFRTATSQDLCFDAGSGSPGPGTPLTVQPCSAGSDQQEFAYNPNLTIRLLSSITDSLPLGMCLQAGAVPHTSSGVPVTFQPCGATTQAAQQFGFNDTANFEGTSNGVTLDGYCFNVQLPDSAGSAVVLNTGGSSCGGPYDNRRAFSPDAAVGAGAAGAATRQLVNFAQFGRCLDVTNQNVGSSYMIVWPCKQVPDATRVLWNQKWTLPSPAGTPGEITTTSPGPATRRCLKSPLSTATGAYVTVIACPATPDPGLYWKVHGYTGDARSFTIVDANGNCLAAADPEREPPHDQGYQISKVVVVTCSGSYLEKWNADPEVLEPTPLKNIRENK